MDDNLTKAIATVARVLAAYAPKEGINEDPANFHIESPKCGNAYASGFGWINAGNGFKVIYEYKGLYVYCYSRITTKLGDTDTFHDIQITKNGKNIILKDMIDCIGD